MTQILINKHRKYEFLKKEEDIYLDGEKMNWDILSKSQNKVHLIVNNRSVSAEVIRKSTEDGELIIRIGGNDYDSKIIDQEAAADGMVNTEIRQVRDIIKCKAPMPGQVVIINVKIGDNVKKGEPLLVLKAMKMENIIQSPGAGIISSIKVSEGDTVIKGQVMVRF
jgi:biotin carboxyl carrier protein